VKRKLFNLASLLSLMLFLTTAVLWVRSYIVSDLLTLHLGHQISQLETTRGGFQFVGLRSDEDHAFDESGWLTGPPKTSGISHVVLGFGFWNGAMGIRTGDGRYSATIRHVADVPHYAIEFLSIILPGWSIAKLRRKHDAPPPTCSRCGYDLTGNTSGICPECGTAVKATAAKV